MVLYERRRLHRAMPNAAALAVLGLLVACGGPPLAVVVDHPVVLTRTPIVFPLNPPLHASGPTFDLLFALPDSSMCSARDWVFYSKPRQPVAVMVTLVAADGHQERLGRLSLPSMDWDNPWPCTEIRQSWVFPTEPLRVYTRIEVASSDSLTIEGLKIRSWHPQPWGL